MAKFEFALKSFLFLAICSVVFSCAQTRTVAQSAIPTQERPTPQRDLKQPTSKAFVNGYKEQHFDIKPSPDDAKRFYKQGIVYGRMRLYNEALAAFELAALLKPNYRDAYFGLGDIYSDMGRWREASRAFRRIIQLNPNDEKAYARLREVNARLASEEKASLSTRKSLVPENNTPTAARVSLESRAQSNPASVTRPKFATRTGEPARIQPTSTPTKPSNPAATKTSQTASNAKPAPGPKQTPLPRSGVALNSQPKSLPNLASPSNTTRNLVPKVPVKKISETVSPLPINSTLLLTTITTAGLKQLDDAPPTKVSDIGSNAGAPTRKETEFSEVAIYRVGVGDALDVRVSGSPPGTPTLFTISASGVLDHPVLPEPLKVIGLTTDEVSESLSNELKRLALSEKKVLVAVAEYNSHTILISGLVNEPGTKSLRREAIPLYVVLAEAQPFAEAGRATILSRDGKTTNVGLLSPEANSFLIRRGDVVLVQAKPELFFYIGGEVKEPGEKPFRQGLKLTQAILAAGGSTRVSKEVLVAREGSHGMLELSVYKLGDIHSGKLPDPTIQPGDRITVVP